MKTSTSRVDTDFLVKSTEARVAELEGALELLLNALNNEDLYHLNIARDAARHVLEATLTKGQS